MAQGTTSAGLSTLQTDTGVPFAETTRGRARWARRAMLTAMAAVVVVALTGFLGVHTSSATAQRDGYTLSLRYPWVARAGLDMQWQVTVHHPGGFGKEVTLAVTADYFDIFENQEFYPEPSETTRDGHTLYLTFTAPRGDTFVVYLDAYIQPASQQGKSARVAVVDAGKPVVWLDYRTRLVP
jgi:hypothetical protein